MNINGYDLDETQVNAIKSDSQNTLVVAGAGSGKTLTILGLIKYLIEEKNYKENEILAISFTNETTISLHNKILDIGYDIEVLTFHKLGLKILGNDYSVCQDRYIDYLIDEYFNSYIMNDKKKKELFKNILYMDKTSNIFNSYNYKNLKILIKTFINLLKSNNQNEIDIYKYYKNSLFNEKILLRIILEIYIVYKRELESVNQIDFNDMISLAIDKVKDSKLPYKYIIIDEFQDTSPVRFNLIKEIIKYTNARLFCVGDDFQSIYRFSGCNLDTFINFNKYFKDSKTYYLKYTYRNSNELIKVSTSFIMKNPKQLKKNIVSPKNLDKPVVILQGYTLKDIIDKIDNPMILGRNNKDIEHINYDNKYTIHKSKGLEADNVILVNSDDIPNNIRNERILRYVLNDKDYILHEEERRLFYVALTRTKNKIYILINKKMSPFIKELIHDYKDYIEINPSNFQP